MNRVNPLAKKPFLPRLALELAPTEDSRALAYAHGLRAQLDALDLTRPAWYVADMPKEELTRAQEEAGEAAFASVAPRPFPRARGDVARTDGRRERPIRDVSENEGS